MGLSYQLHGGVRKSRSLSEVAAVFEPVPSNILGHMYMSIVLVRSRSPVRPSTCHLVEGSYTFQKWSILFSSLCPSSLIICPSHCSFLTRIHSSSRSSVLSSVTSSLIGLSVILLTILEFAPLRAAHTAGVSLHASEP